MTNWLAADEFRTGRDGIQGYLQHTNKSQSMQIYK